MTNFWGCNFILSTTFCDNFNKKWKIFYPIHVWNLYNYLRILLVLFYSGNKKLCIQLFFFKFCLTLFFQEKTSVTCIRTDTSSIKSTFLVLLHGCWHNRILFIECDKLIHWNQLLIVDMETLASPLSIRRSSIVKVSFSDSFNHCIRSSGKSIVKLFESIESKENVVAYTMYTCISNNPLIWVITSFEAAGFG